MAWADTRSVCPDGTCTYDTIQAAIDAAVPGDTIAVGAGVYDENVTINEANLTVVATSGPAATAIKAPIGNTAAAVKIAASDAVLDGFTITRSGNTVATWNDALSLGGVAIQGQAVTNATIRNSLITGNRTGIDINNSSNHTVRNNRIVDNRTGMIMRNQTDGLSVHGNAIADNWTVGVLFLDQSGGTNSPLQQALGSTFTNNDISGNWYGQVVDRQAGGSLPAPGTNVKDFSGNWFGTNAPVVSTDDSGEPGYAAQIPVAFGGTATPPGGKPDIAGPGSANIAVPSWSWLQLRLTSSANVIPTSTGTAVLSASLVDSGGSGTGAVASQFPSTPVAFATSLGSVAPTVASTAGGTASATLSAGPQAGVASVTAALDNAVASDSVTLHYFGPPTPPTPPTPPAPPAPPAPGNAGGPPVTTGETSGNPPAEGDQGTKQAAQQALGGVPVKGVGSLEVGGVEVFRPARSMEHRRPTRSVPVVGARTVRLSGSAVRRGTDQQLLALTSPDGDRDVTVEQKVKIGKRTFTLPVQRITIKQGTSEVVELPLTKRMRKALRKGRNITLTLQITVIDQAGNEVTETKTYSVKSPAQKHKKHKKADKHKKAKKHKQSRGR